MNYEKHGVFRDYTVALQGNDIELEFPKAIDKTNYDKAAEAIDYEYRYDIYPIRLGTDALSYVEKTTEPAVSSSWTKIDSIADTADEDRVSAVFVLPRYESGYAIQYQVRALDDYKKEPIKSLTAPYFYVLQNQAMGLDVTKASRNESGGADIRVTVNNFGLLTPRVDANSAAWSAARRDLISLLGDINFAIEARTYSQAADNTSFIKYLTIKLSELDITKTSYEFTIQTDVSSSTYLEVRGVKSDLSIDFKGFLDNSTYASYAKAVLKVVGDELRIKKGTIQAGFTDEDLSFSPAAAMFTHTEEHTDAAGSTRAGHSIGLYDHHHEPGELQPSDTPSIGFMDTEHNELGNIGISKIGGGQYLSVNNVNSDLYTLRGSGNKLQYWDAAANSGNGEWRTILSSRMTTADNGGVQWDFTKPGQAELKLGDSFYYKEGQGLVFGSGSIGSENLSDELKGSLSAKMVRLSSDGDAVLFDEQGLQPTNQKITFNAELINLSGAVNWSALGTTESGSTAAVDLNINNLTAVLDGTAFNDFYKIDVTVSHNGYSDSKTVYKIKHGMDAEEANSLVQITEWYAITDKSTGVTIGDTSLSWKTTPPIPTKALPYLWNYEVITYTKSEPDISEPMMIGYRASDGRGIEDVRNYYLVSNLDTGITTAAAGWSEQPTNTTEDMPYLWNYEAVYYTDSPNPKTTTPAVIGTHGRKGDKGDEGEAGDDALNGHLTNEHHTIYTDSNGKNNYIGAVTRFVVYEGTKEVTNSWTVTIDESPGIAGKFDDNTHTYTLSDIATDSASVTFNASKAGYEPIEKVFTISRIKQAKDGQSAITYSLGLDTLYFRRDVDGIITPTSTILEGKKVVGNEKPSLIEGYFVIYEQSLDTITIDNFTDLVYKSLVDIEQEYIISGIDFPYVKRYQSLSPEVTINYTPTSNTMKTHIEWYSDPELTNLLDYEQIVVIPDGKDAYKVEIHSTNGNTFKNGVVDTWLYAVVYQGDTDVTSKINEGRFQWERTSMDTEGDKLWNDHYYGGTKEIKITTDDVYKRATFTCSIRKE